MANITVGPIIGKVTHSSARVLIECDSAKQIEMLLTPSTGEPISVKKRVKSNRPGVFVAKGLKAGTTYKVAFPSASCPTSCSLRTPLANPKSMNFGFVSCNEPDDLEKGYDPWGHLFTNQVSTGHIDVLLHMGDQVYGDLTFKRCQNIWDDHDGAISPARKTKMLELYRNLYRSKWSESSQRKTMANVSNLMIWDDHEVTDSWGGKKEFHNKSERDHYIKGIAQQVYREYQRQLWRDLGNGVDSTPPHGTLEDHDHRWGKIGLLMIDMQGGRSHSGSNRLLGAKQWEKIKKRFAKDGTFKATEALVMVSSVPLAYLSAEHTAKSIAMRFAALPLPVLWGYAEKLKHNLMDHWSYKSHVPEQKRLLNLLSKWKGWNDKRSIHVLGGDVHLCMKSTVTHNGAELFQQSISSPITHTPGKVAKKALKKSLEKSDTFGNGFSCDHRVASAKADPNYGILQVRIKDDGQAVMSSKIIVPPIP